MVYLPLSLWLLLGDASPATVYSLCPVERPEHMGAEKQPALVSSYNIQERALVWSARRQSVCWPLERAKTSHGDPGAREPASKGHWNQQEQAELVPSICHVCTRSGPWAPEHRIKPWQAQSRLLECVLRPFCSMHGMLVVVSFFSSKQILGKYSNDRKLSKP